MMPPIGERSRRCAPTLKDVARLARVHPGTASRALNVETRPWSTARPRERVLAAAERARLPPEPDRARSEDKSLIHGRRPHPRPHQPAVPADRARHSGSARGGRLHAADRKHGQRPGSRARRLRGDARAPGRRPDHRHRAPRPRSAGRARATSTCRSCSSTAGSRTAPAVRGRRRPQGARLAVEHLVALGHRRIAHLAGPQELSTGNLRLRGSSTAMRAAGIEPDPELVMVGDGVRRERGRAPLQRAARPRGRGHRDRRRQRPDGTRLLRRLRRPRDRVPGADLRRRLQRHAVRGWFDPPLTTVRLPHYEIGARAAELLLEQLRDPAAEPAQVMLEPELIVRGSTAPPPSA